MASRVQVILEDDFEGGAADETLTFSLDGTEYEIDLSEKNASALRDSLAPWIGHARRVGGRRRRGGGGGTGGGAKSGSASGSDGSSGSTSEIRAWAIAEGYEVSSRGRVSAEVREAYERAHA